MGDCDHQCDDMAAQATPANWPNNHESIGKKGQAFLLPTVTPEDAKKYFPDHSTCTVPSGIDYLRLTPIDSLVSNK